MPRRVRARATRSRAAELRELRDGPGPKSIFATAEERREAWERHREALMASMRPGFRPWAFWELEVPAKRRYHVHIHHGGEAVVLADLGLLTAEEEAVLGPEWDAITARCFDTA